MYHIVFLYNPGFAVINPRFSGETGASHSLLVSFKTQKGRWTARSASSEDAAQIAFGKNGGEGPRHLSRRSQRVSPRCPEANGSKGSEGGLAKQGIDYFPFYLDLIEDRKFRKLRGQFGAVSVLVYLSLLTMIFRDKGYYLEYHEEARYDVVWEVLNHLRGKDEPGEEEIARIIEGLVDSGFFDLSLYRAGILTSRRIQKIFYRITATRRNLEMNFSIWLLDEAEMRAISGRSSVFEAFLKRKPHACSAETRAKKEENHAHLEQRKGKESKAKESKGEEGGKAPRAPTGQYGHVNLSGKEFGELCGQFGEELVRQAVQLIDEYMEMSGKRYQNCALAIRRWGIAAVKERQGARGSPVKKSAFHNFQEQGFDYEAIRSALKKK